MKYESLSIIIPAYNEVQTIAEVVDRVRAVDLGDVTKEIIVIDDGSTDGTRDVLKALAGIRYVFHEKNLGKGGALKTGIRAATGDLIIFQDADLEYDRNDCPAMIAPILSGDAPWVNGVRRVPAEDSRYGRIFGFVYKLGNATITALTNLLYWHHAAEYEGCYKTFPRALLQSVRVETNNFDFDNELVCRLLKRGSIPADVEISYSPRGYAQGKHITWRHGLKILRTIVYTRFV